MTEIKKKFESELYKFAFMPKYDEAIQFLSTSLANKDDEWEYSDKRDGKYPILRSYLEHYFRKLKSENKINFTANNSHACFNTGLVTDNWEEIYAFFELYHNPKPGMPIYCFKSFAKKSNYILLTHFNKNLPDIADFFTKPEDLIFNPKCELIPDIDHIIEDNLERFPEHMQNGGPAETRRKLEGAIEEVKRKVKTNYKTAVPQFFNNRIQLLLPLCLTPNSQNPDLALVVHKLDNTTYTARTCLTLKMAYNNARLIVKPQSFWLKP